MPGLAPNDDPSAVARAVAGASEPWLLVGHLPHLGRLLSLLVFGDPTRDVVAFRMGGVVALRKEEAGFRVRFILTPEIARD
jgi:phosphohistidine phosphatase